MGFSSLKYFLNNSLFMGSPSLLIICSINLFRSNDFLSCLDCFSSCLSCSFVLFVLRQTSTDNYH